MENNLQTYKPVMFLKSTNFNNKSIPIQGLDNSSNLTRDSSRFMHFLKKNDNKIKCHIYSFSANEDISRQLQSHMLYGLSELFDLDYEEMQIQLLNQKSGKEIAKEIILKETLIRMYKSNSN
jgi:hypothetical protein